MNIQGPNNRGYRHDPAVSFGGFYGVGGGVGGGGGGGGAAGVGGVC